MLEPLPIHVVIPDTQAKPGVPTDHLAWISQYIVDQFMDKPNVTLVHLGDHFDMPSLSSYDRGRRAMEGRRVDADIEAGNDAFRILDGALYHANVKRRKSARWQPRKVFLMGNHEDRVSRAVDDNAQLDGVLSLDMLDTLDWERHGFLEPVFIDGVGYSHYWANPMTGRPYGGMALTRLKTIGHSYSMGHQQTLDHAMRFVAGRSQHALIAGACYLHEEDYKGPQGNAHWRGIVVCHEVQAGGYDLMTVSLRYLCRRYEGVDLEDFLR